MHSGILLPLFQESASRALATALRAEEAGVDGVFCYDHIWPMGQPARPSLAPFPVLGAVATRTERITLGTLVARVGLVPDDILLAEFDALAAVANGRVVAGIGTGDRMSAGENEAYGVDFTSAKTRRASLRSCVRQALGRGYAVWVGDGAPATRRIAWEEGAALNVWNASSSQVADAARHGEVTWAGPAPADGEVAPMMARLFESGATWAVFAGDVDLEELRAAADACR